MFLDFGQPKRFCIPKKTFYNPKKVFEPKKIVSKKKKLYPRKTFCTPKKVASTGSVRLQHICRDTLCVRPFKHGGFHGSPLWVELSNWVSVNPCVTSANRSHGTNEFDAICTTALPGSPSSSVSPTEMSMASKCLDVSLPQSMRSLSKASNTLVGGAQPVVAWDRRNLFRPLSRTAGPACTDSNPSTTDMVLTSPSPNNGDLPVGIG